MRGKGQRGRVRGAWPEAISLLVTAVAGCETAPQARGEPAERLQPGVRAQQPETAERVLAATAIAASDPADDPASETRRRERMRAAAHELLEPSRAERWGRQGRLEPEDLSNAYATLADDGVEVFSVLDADGYEGFFKCNLLAFELAYRAGLRVPVISRGRGWAYPGPLAVARMIEGGGVVGGWARLLDGATLEQLLDAEGALLLVGVGVGGRYGHMGVVDVLHDIERASDAVTRVEYTGWEANVERASYRRRTWRLDRFAAIHLLALDEPAASERQVVVVGPPPDWPSLADARRVGPGALVDAALAPRQGPGPRLAIREGELPRLPVAHTLLGEDARFGPAVDVERVLAATRRQEEP
jgi:hypothetical protein